MLATAEYIAKMKLETLSPNFHIAEIRQRKRVPPYAHAPGAGANVLAAVSEHITLEGQRIPAGRHRIFPLRY